MLIALIFAAALQTGVPPSEGSPEDKAAALAAADFVVACMLPLSAYATGAEYARASQQMGSGVPSPAPSWAAAVRIDGAGDQGCRVRYTGPKAEFVWEADAKFLRSLPAVAADPANGCAFTTDTPMRLAGVCASTSDDPEHRTRRADVLLERSASSVTAAVTHPRP